MISQYGLLIPHKKIFMTYATLRYLYTGWINVHLCAMRGELWQDGKKPVQQPFPMGKSK
jgi:hypothetical protein